MTPADAGLVVMYHYVRPRAERSPGGIRPLAAEDFETQLDWLAERYRICDAKTFVRWLTAPSGRPACLLTFDDGTRDHHDIVLPILKRRGLSGVFFVLTWPAELARMPLSHALHWLLGGDEEEVWEALLSHARRAEADPGDPAEARRIYHYESELRARIKYAANMALPPAVLEAVVAERMAAAGISEAALAADWFVSADQIRRLHAAGMTIGVHGCSHTSLRVLGAEGIRGEIRHASRYLRELLGHAPRWFACPFGGSSGDPEVISAMHDAMNEAGLDYAVSTQKGLASAGCDPRAIPRLDAIDLPPRGDALARCVAHA